MTLKTLPWQDEIATSPIVWWWGVFLAASPNGVKMWARWDAGIPTRGDSGLADDGVNARWFRPALVGLVVAVACDLLDEIDDASPKLGLLDSHEGLGQ